MIDRTLHYVPGHIPASLRDATPSRTRFLQTLRPYRTLGLRSSVGDPSVSPQTVFNPNHESTINNRKSIPVPAGPNVCSTIPERGHPSRRDGMFILTWHI